MYKICFIGCVKSSYVYLNELIKNNVQICGVITKEKSDFNSDFVNLGPICEQNNIPYIYVDNVNGEQSTQFISSISADIGFCFGWSQLIKKQVIDMFPKGIVGYHPAELPNNRGRHPIIWALALGLDRTASTFFFLDEFADTGNIVSQKKLNIEYEDDAESLMDKLLECGKEQVIDIVNRLNSDTLIGTPQEEIGNTWRKRGKADGLIDWRMSSRSIYNLVRALTKPYVGAHYLYNGIEIKVWKVKEIPDNTHKNIEPGKVVLANKDSFIIKTGDNLLEVYGKVPGNLQAGDYL